MNEISLFRQLQSCCGLLPDLLREINGYCARSGRLETAAGATTRVAQLLDLLATREGALAFLAAHAQTRWPISYGQSPYDDIANVIRSAVRGVQLPRGATATMREIHASVLERLGPPAALARIHLDEGGRRRRYRRLLRAMQHAALLSPGEADSAVRVLLRYHPDDRHSSPASCEAVAHFGGNAAAVCAARRWRHRFAASRLLEAA